MFIINGIAANREDRCFLFDSLTIAMVIADKLERLGLEVKILDQRGDDGELPPDPYERHLGLLRFYSMQHLDGLGG